jgi:NADH-quinone oxidoreductase subunit C
MSDRASLPLPGLAHRPPEGVEAKKDTDLATPWPRSATDLDLLKLADRLGDGAEEIFEQAGECTCQVAKERILEVLKICRGELAYEMLSDETGTHYPTAEGFAFSVVYHLTSISRKKRLRLRILIPEGFEPESATQIYPAADWLEREIFDMLGIRFQHHPDLARILCPDDWEGHPLRKEYPVEGKGQREIQLREDRSGFLDRLAIEQAGKVVLNVNVPRAE